MEHGISARSPWGRRIAKAALCCLIAGCSPEAQVHKADEAPTKEQTDADEAPTNATKVASCLDAFESEAQLEPELGEPATFDLYDPDRITLIELTLDEAAMRTLSDANEVADKTWVHAQFKSGDVTFADVGVRIKGSSTRRLLPAKASLKVKLNKWVKGQKLGRTKELTLHNMASDPTFLAERITYHVFRSLGLPAPYANTACVRINGEDYGIFANVETPGSKFLERVFGKEARSLYEVNWGGGPWLPGKGAGFEIDIPAPGAAAGEKPDLDLLFEAVAAADDETLLDELAERLDTKQWLRFSAAEAVTGHYDGYAYGAWGSHNYFMTGAADGKFSLLPWSTDLSLSNREGIPDASSPLSTTVLARCRRSACWEAYKAEVRSVLAVYESLDLVKLAHDWHEQIDPLVRADTKREESLSAYEGETENLYKFLATRPAVVRAQLGL